MLTSSNEAERDVAKQLGVFFPNQKGRTRITNRGDDTASTAAIVATVQGLTVRLRPPRTRS